MALLLVTLPEDADGAERVALLRCDACGEPRIFGALTIVGEIHGCARLGAFRMTTESVLVRVAP